MKRILFLAYGVLAYVLFLVAFLYLVGFLADRGVPRSIDGPVALPLAPALLVDVALLAVFGLQHSVMARPRFKEAWTRVIPRPLERSTYVLASAAALAVLFAAWQPIPAVVWQTSGTTATVLLVLLGVGALTVVGATFLIDHFELFGLRQVWDTFHGRPTVPPRFRLTAVHRVVRHPLYVGWLITFFATPVMTVGHLLFSLGMLGYILVAIPYEERDLVREHGAAYQSYRERVPALVPLLRAGRRPPGT